MDETTKSAKAPAKPRKTAAKKTTAKTAATPEVAPAARKLAAVASAPAPRHTNGAAARTSGSREEIARLAHKFWAERGHQHGHHVEDWLRAEQELRKMAS
jgi:hypothetical protein